MNQRRALAALTGMAVLPLLPACPGGSQPASGEEDCDADDLIEGDEDCDDAAKRKRKKSTNTRTKPKSRTGGGSSTRRR